MPTQTLSSRYAQFTRDMVRLLAGRACDCELPGLEALLARAHACFKAAAPHLAQMERGCTRSDLGELQCALIDKAGYALFVVVVAVASEVGMSLTEPARLDAGRIAAIEMLGVMALYLDADDAAAHEAFLAPTDECDAETAGDHAS